MWRKIIDAGLAEEDVLGVVVEVPQQPEAESKEGE
jgi:hypothetical protein